MENFSPRGGTTLGGGDGDSENNVNFDCFENLNFLLIELFENFNFLAYGWPMLFTLLF